MLVPKFLKKKKKKKKMQKDKIYGFREWFPMQDVIFTSSEAPLSRGAIILLWGAIFSLPGHFDAGVPLFTPGVPSFHPWGTLD